MEKWVLSLYSLKNTLGKRVDKTIGFRCFSMDRRVVGVYERRFQNQFAKQARISCPKPSKPFDQNR